MGKPRTIKTHATLKSIAAAAIAAVIASSVLAAPPKAPDEIVVFAAASLKNALDDISAAWSRQSGKIARISYAGSSKLAKQIQEGAPADVFISANTKWMDVLARKSLIDPASRRDLLRNRIVLVAHGKDARRVVIEQGFDLSGLLGEGRLAMAMTDSVPAGIYGKAALTSLGVWDKVAPKVAQTDNVRAALALVARGEAPFGIVYATDAVASDNVTVAATFPANSHPEVVYPVAATSESNHIAAARQFLDFLTTKTATSLFEKNGFAVIAPAPVN